jgi:hypothetical protein
LVLERLEVDDDVEPGEIHHSVAAEEVNGSGCIAIVIAGSMATSRE